jgi:hypothetical protein
MDKSAVLIGNKEALAKSLTVAKSVANISCEIHQAVSFFALSQNLCLTEGIRKFQLLRAISWVMDVVIAKYLVKLSRSARRKLLFKGL